MKLLWFVAAPHVMQAVTSTIQHGHDVEIILATWIVDPDNYNTNNIVCHIVQSPAELFDTLDQVLANNKIDYLVPSFPDAMTERIAEICGRHSVAFVSQSSARVLSSKTNYYRVWQALKIPTPSIYRDLAQVQLPCIVKPSRGQASIDVKILSGLDDVSPFFSRDNFIVQQYIQGRVVSFVGTVVDGNINIDLCYDIESDAFPYAPETGLIFPSKYTALQPEVIHHLQRFFDAVKLNNAPFMLDIMVDASGKAWFIDFAARLSMGGLLLMQHGGENNYVSKMLGRINHEPFTVRLSGAVLFRQLGLPCGNIKHIVCDKSDLAAKIELPKQVVVACHDNCIYPNGYAIIVDHDRQAVEAKFRQCVDSIYVEYSEEK